MSNSSKIADLENIDQDVSDTISFLLDSVVESVDGPDSSQHESIHKLPQNNEDLTKKLQQVNADQVDSGSQNNHVQASESTGNAEESQAEVTDKLQDVTLEQEQYKSKKSHIFSCVAGSCVGLAIAYFLGATSVYVATVGMVLAGALLGYSIAKLCDKVGTKVNNLSAEQHIVKEIAV